MSLAGISFENADSSKESPGMIYFGPQSLTMYLVNASAYQLASHVDSSKKAYNIEVVGPGSRLNFSIRKEVSENGWTAAFGK